LPPEENDRQGDEAKTNASELIQGAVRFYILIETLSEFKHLKFLNNEFAAGKLNIDHGEVVCQEVNSTVAHYWIYLYQVI